MLKVPIKVNNFNNGKILTINIKINNTDAIFLLDTGSSLSIIDLRKIDKFTNKKLVESFDISDLSKNIKSYDIDIENFTISNKTFKTKIKVVDLINLNNTLSSNYINVIDGIIGNDIIFDHISSIDIENKNLILKQMS